MWQDQLVCTKVVAQETVRADGVQRSLGGEIIGPGAGIAVTGTV